MKEIVDQIVFLTLVLLCVAVWAIAINATVVHRAASTTPAPKPHAGLYLGPDGGKSA